VVHSFLRTEPCPWASRYDASVIASHTPNYGFKYNAARDGHEVDEERMEVVRHIIRMIGAEGCILYRPRWILENAGVPTGCGEDWIGCES